MTIEALPQPYRCLSRLDDDVYADLLEAAAFRCCFWRNQTQGLPVLCPYALVLTDAWWHQLSTWSEALYSECLEAEQMLLGRPDLQAQLGLGPRLTRALGKLSPGPRPEVRAMRFDFHWTVDSWRISEANTDVMGGFIESSGVTALMAQCYRGPIPTGDPAGALADALASHSPVGLMHLTFYSDDRQIMLYLAQRIEQAGGQDK